MKEGSDRKSADLSNAKSVAITDSALAFMQFASDSAGRGGGVGEGKKIR